MIDVLQVAKILSRLAASFPRKDGLVRTDGQADAQKVSMRTHNFIAARECLFFKRGFQRIPDAFVMLSTCRPISMERFSVISVVSLYSCDTSTSAAASIARWNGETSRRMQLKVYFLRHKGMRH
jgi:hypothetical protein